MMEYPLHSITNFPFSCQRHTIEENVTDWPRSTWRVEITLDVTAGIVSERDLRDYLLKNLQVFYYNNVKIDQGANKKVIK